MHNNAKCITTKVDFDVAWKLINQIFYIDQEMPNQVFKRPFSGFVFEEFDWTISGEFWDSFLKPLSIVLQDTSILTASLDPHPVDYFYPKFGYYNMIEFSTAGTESDYWDALETGPENYPVDAILYSAETMVWIPSSAKWAIWGDRGYEICVLAFADDSVKKAAKPLLQAWYPADQALNSYIADRVPRQFLDTLIKNYST